MTSAGIANLAEARVDCRLNRDWVQADTIRQRLQDNEIFVEDTKQGCRWHRMDQIEGGEICIVEDSPDLRIRDLVTWRKRQRRETEEGSHGGQ